MAHRPIIKTGFKVKGFKEGSCHCQHHYCHDPSSSGADETTLCSLCLFLSFCLFPSSFVFPVKVKNTGKKATFRA